MRSSAPRAVTLEASASSPLRRVAIFVLCQILIGLIGLLDHVTGTELRIYPLYTVPIAASTWVAGARLGALASILAVFVWAASNHLAGLRFPALVWSVNATAHLAAFVTVVLLVSYLQRSHAAEQRRARTDALTGLLNTRGFYELAAAEIARHLRYQHPLTVAFVDLDGFKEVNDRLGHKQGDAVIVSVARTLRETTRSSDLVARLGGDEFALLLPETEDEGARAILERARHALARESSVRCSIGAVCFESPPAGVDAMVTAADRLMYEVKRAGKDAVRVERLRAEPCPAETPPASR